MSKQELIDKRDRNTTKAESAFMDWLAEHRQAQWDVYIECKEAAQDAQKELDALERKHG